MAFFSSSTQEIPENGIVPKHIAVIMDGNGRWAKKRLLPRVAGHKRGVDVVRSTIQECDRLGVEYLTLFAFSSENWRRPADEVNFLMNLFLQALSQEVNRLHKNQVRLRVIGDRSRFDQKLIDAINTAEAKTAENTKLNLTIAANYGGRWDVMQALSKLLQSGVNLEQECDEALLTPHLSMSFAPEPDLFIRTGGEQRISNFLLWQLAYTELYFTETLWPDFDESAFKLAINSYQTRERRFGRIGEQVPKNA